MVGQLDIEAGVFSKFKELICSRFGNTLSQVVGNEENRILYPVPESFGRFEGITWHTV